MGPLSCSGRRLVPRQRLMRFIASLMYIRHIVGATDLLSRGMSVLYYRLYRLSGPGGHFVGFDEIEAPDDAAALVRAAALSTDRSTELWCGARKIQTFQPRSAPPDGLTA